MRGSFDKNEPKSYINFYTYELNITHRNPNKKSVIKFNTLNIKSNAQKKG